MTVNYSRRVKTVAFAVLCIRVSRNIPRFCRFLEQRVHTESPCGVRGLRLGLNVDVDSENLLPGQIHRVLVIRRYVIVDAVFVVVSILPVERVLMIQRRNLRAFGRDDRNANIVAVLAWADRSNNQLIVEYGLILFNIAVTRFVVCFGFNSITVRVGLIDRVEDIRGRVGNNVISYCLFAVFISVIVVIIDRQAYQFWFISNIDWSLCELVFALTSIKPEQILFNMLVEILTLRIEAIVCIFLNNLFNDGLSRRVVILKVEVLVNIGNVVAAISIEHVDDNVSWRTLINIVITKICNLSLICIQIHFRNCRAE